MAVAVTHDIPAEPSSSTGHRGPGDASVGRRHRPLVTLGAAQRIPPAPAKRPTRRGCRSDSTASTSAANPSSSSPKLTV
jgi:hypothetical protein